MVRATKLWRAMTAGAFMLAGGHAQGQTGASDFCALAGALNHMLKFIDNRCSRYELTHNGRAMLIESGMQIFEHAEKTGVTLDRCLDDGMFTVLAKLAKRFPGKLEGSFNDGKLRDGMCDAIATELRQISGHGAALFTRR